MRLQQVKLFDFSYNAMTCYNARFFFFPAEDGIRDLIVTGVQTCALPISGEVGEVVHRSPHLMLGYFHDDERTAAAFQGGWFHSGDLATIDEEGYITIVDRKKDMIKTGGENVASREVEEALYLIPEVSEVAVVGLPHPRWVEAVVAVVVARSGAEVS